MNDGLKLFNIRARITLLGFIVFFIGLTSPAAYSDRPVLKVAYAHWPPWKIIENDSFDGIDKEILAELANRVEIKLEYIGCPWKRCVEMMKKGEIDLITSFGRNKKREAFSIYLTPPYVTQRVQFYKVRGSETWIESIDDLYPYKIGVIKGSMYYDTFDQATHLEKIDVDFENQLFQMALTRRIDLFIGFQYPIQYLMTKAGIEEKFIQMPLTFSAHSSYIAISKQSKYVHLVPKLNAALASMNQTGEIDMVIADFFNRLKISPKP